MFMNIHQSTLNEQKRGKSIEDLKQKEYDLKHSKN